MEDLTGRMDRLESQIRDLLDGLARSRHSVRVTPDQTPAPSDTAFDGDAATVPPTGSDARELYEVAYAATYLPSWLWAPTEGLRGLFESVA